MAELLDLWSRAALTSLSFFWSALWAFVLGYAVSSLIQVFVTRSRMQRAMGDAGPRSVALGTLFGFISSSCSFAALSTTRSLFRKGAGLVPSLAFLLASTNLVIELGFVIAVFLSWEFVVGEYLGGLLLILVTWALVRLTRPARLVEQARGEDPDEASEEESRPLSRRLRSKAAWRDVARRYFMEWDMVVKDVTIGFAAAGAIAVFVPRSFFQALFPGGAEDAGFGGVLLDALIGPVAAFCPFIGSMGNVPLAGLLYHNGVSFAGVMAFLFSDLVVLPVLRIQIGYNGWRLALYIGAIFLAALVTVSVTLHYLFDAFGALPDGVAASSGERGPSFAIDHTFYLNLAFGALTAGLWWLRRTGDGAVDECEDEGDERSSGLSLDRVLVAIAWIAAGWVSIGALLSLVR
ncbi:permease [Engelhardtia mirabilis]|uniref:Putative permease n=1 Tax=Engelhardtia mirabilis TaxID=2528011 RepID=A0A518BMH6_9BACT|nr:putative permease [Planctomycetes bacterium Pla133]QDV02507.1 putative permease [Planctomycetes bacterium Pla86]